MNRFSWEDYLADTSAEIATENLFDHVNRSLETLIKPFQFLLYQETKDVWIPAQVIIVTKTMMSIAIYKENQKSTNPVWLLEKDYSSKIKYIPEHQIPNNVKNCNDKSSVPNIFFKYKKLFVYECILPGYLFECEFPNEPNKIWLVKVIKNQGGLLMLSWYGDSNSDNKFIIHYLNRRIHQLGFASSIRLPLTKPIHMSTVRLPKEDNLPTLESNDLEYGHPLFNSKPGPHEFKEGWRLEAVHPSYPYYFQPAIISKIIDEHYFLIKLDDMLDEKENMRLNSEKTLFLGYSGLGTILPANTSFTKGIRFKAPTGWSSDIKFTWSRYLLNYEYPGDEERIIDTMEKLVTDANPSKEITEKIEPNCPDENYFRTSVLKKNHFTDSIENDCNLSVNTQFNNFMSSLQTEFFLGMKIEFIHPLDSVKVKNFPIIISGTITRVKGKLLWILPDHQDKDLLPNYISNDLNATSIFFVDSASTEIFPLGWCHFVGYQQFYPPIFYLNPRKVLSPYDSIDSEQFSQSNLCPKIYFNSKCYPGPFLKTANLMKIPKTFGPGPIKEVIHSILKSIVKYSEKPLKILRLLEADWFNQLSNNLSKSLDNPPGTSKTNKEPFQNILDESFLNSIYESRQDKMDLVILRGRCPGKKSRVLTAVEIPRKVCALDEYLRQISLLLEACPNFISVTLSSQEADSEGKCPCFCAEQITAKKYERLPNLRKKIQMNSANVQRHSIQNNNNNNPIAGKKRSLISIQQIQNSFLYDLVPPVFRVISPAKTQSVRNSSVKSYSNSRRITRNSLDFPSENYQENSSMENGFKEKKLKLDISPKNFSKSVNADEKKLYIDLVSEDDEEVPSTMSQSPWISSSYVDKISLETNPMEWSCRDTQKYLKKTDCSDHLPWIKSQSIDGQSFLLLNPNLLSDIGMSSNQIDRLMRHVSMIREAFIRQFSHTQPKSDKFVNIFKNHNS